MILLLLLALINDFKVMAIEFSFPVKDNIFIQATDAILAKLKEMGGTKSIKHQWASSNEIFCSFVTIFINGL